MNKKIENDIEELASSIAKLDDDKSYDFLFTQETVGNLWAYQNNYLIGHIDRLILIYETALKTVGEKNFKYLSRKYLLAFPPHSESLDDFGDSFDLFLKNCNEVKNIFFLPSLAKLDWLLYERSLLKQELVLPEGSLAIWQAIKNGQELKDMTLSDEVTETIRIEIYNSEYFLVKSVTI